MWIVLIFSTVTNVWHCQSRRSQPYWAYRFRNIPDYHNYHSFKRKTFIFPAPQGEFVDDGTETHFSLGDHDCCIKAVSSGKRRDGIIHTMLVDGMEISESEWTVGLSVLMRSVYMDVGMACAHLWPVWPQISMCWFSNGPFWGMKDRCVLQTYSLELFLYTSHSSIRKSVLTIKMVNFIIPGGDVNVLFLLTVIQSTLTQKDVRMAGHLLDSLLRWPCHV